MYVGSVFFTVMKRQLLSRFSSWLPEGWWAVDRRWSACRPAGQDPSHHPGQEQGSQDTRDSPSPEHLASPWGQREAGVWVWLGGAHGCTKQCCGELETGPVVVSLGQGLTASGAEKGSWATGRDGGDLGDVGQSCLCPPGPSESW